MEWNSKMENGMEWWMYTISLDWQGHVSILMFKILLATMSLY